MALLKSFAGRFFSGDVAIQVTEVTSTGVTTQQTAQGSGEGGSEIVREALRIFGGSIKGVRKENA